MSRDLGRVLRAWLPELARARRWSLRARLVALVLGLVLISCAIVAAATTFALHRFLLDRLDQQLAAAGVRYSESLEHPGFGAGKELRFDTVVGQPPGTLGARIVGGKLTAIGVVGAGSGHRTPSAGDQAVIAAMSASPAPRTIRLPELGEYRVTVVAGAQGELLLTGLPEYPVDETIGRLSVIEAIVFTGVLGISAVAAAVCVRLTLRPLNRVASTALAVSDLPLGAGDVVMPGPVPNPAPSTEVGQVTEAFNHMLEHVEAALEQRHASEGRLRHFIADASHELRTPIAVVRSHAEYARRTSGELPAGVSQALARIGSESYRMGRLVEDLLLLARLDSGRSLARDRVDLTRLTLDALGDARVAAGEHRWQLDLPEEPVYLTGDEHALHQVLANLLSNARAHTPAGTTVTTRLRRTRDGVELCVSDDGPGIPPEVVPQVMGRFVRADSGRSRAGAHTGLGLSIADSIVGAHGGTIEVSSRPGHTEFIVHLPAELDVVAASAAQDDAPS